MPAPPKPQICDMRIVAWQELAPCPPLLSPLLSIRCSCWFFHFYIAAMPKKARQPTEKTFTHNNAKAQRHRDDRRELALRVNIHASAPHDATRGIAESVKRRRRRVNSRSTRLRANNNERRAFFFFDRKFKREVKRIKRKKKKKKHPAREVIAEPTSTSSSGRRGDDTAPAPAPTPRRGGCCWRRRGTGFR